MEQARCVGGSMDWEGEEMNFDKSCYVPPEPPLGEYGEVSDGFGSVWLLCKPDCGIEVVRPGKAQCECDFKEDE